MAKKKPKKLGFDPLAWMKQEEPEPEVPSTSVEGKRDAADLKGHTDAAGGRSPGAADGGKKRLNKKTANAKPAARKRKQASSEERPQSEKASGGKPATRTPAAPGPESQAGSAAGVVVMLPESLCMEQMMELHQELKRALEGHRPVVLNAEAVEATHAAGLQLLTAFFGEAVGRGAQVQWQGPSEELLESARLLGLSEALQLPAT